MSLQVLPHKILVDRTFDNLTLIGELKDDGILSVKQNGIQMNCRQKARERRSFKFSGNPTLHFLFPLLVFPQPIYHQLVRCWFHPIRAAPCHYKSHWFLMPRDILWKEKIYFRCRNTETKRDQLLKTDY